MDVAIALLGRWSANRGRHAADRPPHEVLKAEGRRLRRVLWINAALDVLYVGAGLVLALTVGRSSSLALGHGIGVVLQGAFLLVFDVIHAQAVPPAPLSRPFQSFQHPRHRGFFLQGGEPGALLVHGFPGTPAEMLPLGRLLHREGWSVQGLLLPGFGAEFPALMSMPHDRWREAVVEALAVLRKSHRPLLLAGYSLGAALSIAAARIGKPDALLLLAPFWQLGSPLLQAAGSLLRPFLPQYLRLFAEADFRDPQLRGSLGEFFPDADLDDPEFQGEIRELSVPLRLLGELARAGRRAYRDAAAVDAPVFILQGLEDELARLEPSRRLAARFPNHTGDNSMVELPAGHRLLAEEAPWWGTLAESTAGFARSVVSGRGSEP